MTNRFTRNAFLIFSLLGWGYCAAGPVPAIGSDALSYRALIRTVRWALVDVEGLDPQEEKPAELAATIRKDVQVKLKSAGLAVRVTSDKRQLKARNHLRVHVHKIELERTVYMSTLELVVASPAPETLDPAVAPPPRYTKISNQLKTVRRKIDYILNELIRDYVK